MNKIWLRQEGESEKAFSAFKMYLETDERTLKKVAEKCSKSVSLINRWSAEYDWKNRATAYDNANLEEMRQSFFKRYYTFLDKQFSTNEKLQARLIKALTEKDLDRISWRSLNEVWRGNFTEMINFAKELGLNEKSVDNTLTIEVVSK